MDEDYFEIDTGSHDGLQGIKQEDPAQETKGSWKPWKRSGTSGREQVDRCLHHERTIVTTTKEAAVFDDGHVAIDSALVRERDYVPVAT